MALAYGNVCAQTPTLQGLLLRQYSTDPIVKAIDGSRRRINPIGNPEMLISWYSWKNLTTTDFATLTGLDNSANSIKIRCFEQPEIKFALIILPLRIWQHGVNEIGFTMIYF